MHFGSNLYYSEGQFVDIRHDSRDQIPHITVIKPLLWNIQILKNLTSDIYFGKIQSIKGTFGFISNVRSLKHTLLRSEFELSGLSQSDDYRTLIIQINELFEKTIFFHEKEIYGDSKMNEGCVVEFMVTGNRLWAFSC